MLRGGDMNNDGHDRRRGNANPHRAQRRSHARPVGPRREWSKQRRSGRPTQCGRRQTQRATRPRRIASAAAASPAVTSKVTSGTSARTIRGQASSIRHALAFCLAPSPRHGPPASGKLRQCFRTGLARAPVAARAVLRLLNSRALDPGFASKTPMILQHATNHIVQIHGIIAALPMAEPGPAVPNCPFFIDFCCSQSVSRLLSRLSPQDWRSYLRILSTWEVLLMIRSMSGGHQRILIALVALAVVGIALSNIARATIIAYEPFDYPVGDAVNGKNGGQGWTGAWTSPRPASNGPRGRTGRFEHGSAQAAWRVRLACPRRATTRSSQERPVRWMACIARSRTSQAPPAPRRGSASSPNGRERRPTLWSVAAPIGLTTFTPAGPTLDCLTRKR